MSASMGSQSQRMRRPPKRADPVDPLDQNGVFHTVSDGPRIELDALSQLHGGQVGRDHCPPMPSMTL